MTQVQIDPSHGVGHAEALRIALRHDPDILLVSTLKDAQTTALAVDAAIRGKLVLSTLPTRSLGDTVLRLVEGGVPPYLLSASLLGVVGQRLTLRLCPRCRQPTELDPPTQALIERAGLDPVSPFYRSEGCSSCHDRGHLGRVLIYELVEADAGLRAAIHDLHSAEGLHAAAVAAGMVPVLRNALALARKGVIGMETLAQLLD